MTIKISAALNSLSRGQALAVSIPSSGAGRLAWVGVYPLDMKQTMTRELLRNHGQPMPLPGVRVYRVRKFEVDHGLIERDVWIAEPELENKANYFAFGEEHLAETLLRLGVQIEQLELPYKSNYPI